MLRASATLLQVVFCTCLLAAQEPLPDVYTWDPGLIAESRARSLAGDPYLAQALNRLRSDADGELKGELLKVTDKPDDIAEKVGGKHNYASISVYFWPDERDPDAPWAMRDGKRNVQAISRFDAPRMTAMTKRVITCSQAYYFTGDEKYAARAAEQLRAWFIGAATRMNPHMEYAQCVPNKSKGSPWGIIDAHQFPYMLDGVMLLAGSRHWSVDDHTALRAWFAQFTQWLNNSELGKRERAAANNHGTFYDLLVARSAVFCGEETLARDVVGAFGRTRIATQIGIDGSTPHEQQRVNSAMYTCWNLKGMADMTLLARRLGVDLWAYQGAQGQSLSKATQWLTPYVEDPSKWAFGDGQFSESSAQEFFWILRATQPKAELAEVFRQHICPAATGKETGREKWRSSRLMLLFPFEHTAAPTPAGP